DVVYCVDDAVAAGVALAIEDAGMKGEIMTIGINGEPNAFDLIKDGHNYVTLKQHIEWSASEVVSAAYNIVNGEDVDWVIDEWEVVTAENVDSTTPAWPE
uniref:sugar ABC transporter substrate-binding protein n=1 Tax=Massilicoli timonensis TaxID=2015901 RepID=UPI003AABE389